jgi:hypothetical protein
MPQTAGADSIGARSTASDASQQAMSQPPKTGCLMQKLLRWGHIARHPIQASKQAPEGTGCQTLRRRGHCAQQCWTRQPASCRVKMMQSAEGVAQVSLHDNDSPRRCSKQTTEATGWQRRMQVSAAWQEAQQAAPCISLQVNCCLSTNSHNGTMQPRQQAATISSRFQQLQPVKHRHKLPDSAGHQLRPIPQTTAHTTPHTPCRTSGAY